MSDRRFRRQMPAPRPRADRLSPDVKEFLHMLQVIEDDPGACAKDDSERH